MSGTLLVGDCREQLATLPEGCCHLCVTSPPYWGLRDYGVSGQLGSEPTPEAFVANLVAVFREVRRVLHPSGVVALNLGSTYAGGGGFWPDAPSNQAGSISAGGAGRGGAKTAGATRTVPGLKPKDLVLIPALVALALQADGWWIRAEIPWVKANPMPESVTDRPSVSHETIWLLAKSERYYWDAEAIKVAAINQTGGGFGPSLPEGTLRNDVGRPRGDYASGRTRRTGDWTRESLALAAATLRAQADDLERRGLLLDGDGDPLALMVNPRPFRGSHFATFPPALVEPFVKAGTSERGCCPECGEPWRRVVQRGNSEHHCRPGCGCGDGNKHGKQDWGQSWKGYGGFTGTAVDTGLWASTCTCDAGEPQPAVILDPFMGSGTTAIVAEALGRDWVGCELSQEYADLAIARIANRGDIGAVLDAQAQVAAGQAVMELDL